jgi:hypothetical protein
MTMRRNVHVLNLITQAKDTLLLGLGRSVFVMAGWLLRRSQEVQPPYRGRWRSRVGILLLGLWLLAMGMVGTAGAEGAIEPSNPPGAPSQECQRLDVQGYPCGVWCVLGYTFKMLEFQEQRHTAQQLFFGVLIGILPGIFFGSLICWRARVKAGMAMQMLQDRRTCLHAYPQSGD